MWPVWGLNAHYDLGIENESIFVSSCVVHLCRIVSLNLRGCMCHMMCYCWQSEDMMLT